MDFDSVEKLGQPTGISEYARLRDQLERAGLLRKREGWYLWLILILGSGLVAGSLVMLLAESFPIRLLAALGLSVLSTHVGFLGHDAIHQQVFRRSRHNKVLGLTCKNLLLGSSAGWWHDNHSRHHTDSNIIGRDPNMDIPVFAYTDAQAQQKPRFLRPLVRFQAYLMFPFFCLEAFSARIETIRFLWRQGGSQRRLEMALLTAHAVGFVTIFCWQGIVEGLVLMVIHQAVTGLYLASTFAPNHKGMPHLEDGSGLDFLRRQVLTSRNVTAHPFVNLMYGGLNSQIEHHLFPTMARPNLPAAREVVREFCLSHAISYHETTVIGSYREILSHMSNVSRRMAAA